MRDGNRGFSRKERLENLPVIPLSMVFGTVNGKVFKGVSFISTLFIRRSYK